MSTETDNASGVQNDPVTTESRQGALETIPTAAEIHDDAFPPNTPFAASTTSFILGGFFSICLWAVLYNSGFLSAVIEGGWTNITFNQPFVQLPFFIGAWAFFHWAEFAVTAGWNREKCSSHSFLLDNGKEYHIAHSVAIIEFVITSYFFPGAKRWDMITPLGILVTIFGQVIRSIAMIHASTNFSHMVAYQHREGHRLVKGGIYSWSRHPSYAGFFYWGIGTQLVLQNYVSFFGYAVVLFRFFNRRIFWEEKALVRFFGTEYQEYRARVPTRIPFIR